MSDQKRVLVTGAGGFIAHHLTSNLKKQGYRVRGVDKKRPRVGGVARRRVRWSMDLHPDSGIAAGMLTRTGVLGRFLSWANEIGYRRQRGPRARLPRRAGGDAGAAR